MLYSASDGEAVRVLADHVRPEVIVSTAVDPVHGQVLYTVGNSATGGLELHRVGLDGSGEQRLASAPVGQGRRGSMALSRDYADFVIDTCEADLSCQRQVIELATLEVHSFSLELGAELCEGLGVVDGLVVMRTGFSCQAFGADDLVIMELDGGNRRVLPDVGSATLVGTSQGPRIVYRRSSQDADLQVLNLATGARYSLGLDMEGLMPLSQVRLPQDWLLLGPWYWIGDFPVSPQILRGEPPLLLNIVTGETIELVNLPH